MKVSIILPIYNGEKYIDLCIKSLLNQTLKNYEIICINDGSTDGSRKILDNYQKKYFDKIKVFHIENSGVWEARNFGIKQARGEYIGFCDCDDCVKPEMYQELYERIKKDGSDMAVCAYKRVDIQTGKLLCCEMKKFGEKVITVQENKDLLPVINTSLWNKLIRRDVVEKHINFTVAPRVAEDMMFLLSVYPFVKKISFFSKPLYIYRVRSDSAMSYIKKEEIPLLKDSMVQTKEYVLKRAGNEWKDVINLFVLIHFGAAVVLKSASGRRKEIIAMQKDIQNWMEIKFKGWKQNSYLKLSFVLNGHKYLIKPMLILWMYQTGLFSVFLRLYLCITKLLNIDIKW